MLLIYFARNISLCFAFCVMKVLHVDCLEIEQRADTFLKLDFCKKIRFKKCCKTLLLIKPINDFRWWRVLFSCKLLRLGCHLNTVPCSIPLPLEQPFSFVSMGLWLLWVTLTGCFLSLMLVCCYECSYSVQFVESWPPGLSREPFGSPTLL